MTSPARALLAFAAVLSLSLLPPAPPARGQDRPRGRADPAAERELPPVVIPPAREGERYVRLLVFGDWGTGRPSQASLARAMAARARAERPDALLTTGDNFYPRGVTAVDDPQWRTMFEEVYADPALADLPVYPSLGNHDWLGDVQAQVAYSDRNPRWRLPARYHAFTLPARTDAEPLVELFVLDTQPLIMRDSEPAQLAWLDERLAASKAPWKVVYGHHPVYSHGRHGHTSALVRLLQPLLARHRVDLYLAGHDHTLELLRPIDGVHHVVSGGGGGPDMAYAVEWTDAAYYAATGGGFTALRVGKDELVIEFVRMDGRTQFAHTLIKGTSGPF